MPGKGGETGAEKHPDHGLSGCGGNPGHELGSLGFSASTGETCVRLFGLAALPNNGIDANVKTLALTSALNPNLISSWHTLSEA